MTSQQQSKETENRDTTVYSPCKWVTVVCILQVFILLCVESPYEVDRISFDLPMMKQMGDSIHMEVKSVRPYEAFYDDIKKMASS